MSIKNIVFDFGNVICKYSPEAMLKQFSLTQDDEKLFIEKIFESPLWKDADRGYSFRDVLFCDVLQELPEHLRKVFYACVARYDFEERFMPLNPGIDSLIFELKQQGYGIFLLSNIGYGIHNLVLKMSLFSAFDGKFASCDYGLIKPDKRVCEAFFDSFSLIPEECIFIDDSYENVLMAKEAGMAAVQYNALYEDVGSLCDKLEKFGIECKF